MSIRKVKMLHDTIARQLAKSNSDRLSTEQEAWWLLEALTDKDKTVLLADGVIAISAAQEKRLNNWISLRVQEGKPLQYILGHVPFCDIEVLVRPPVLIPRVETEEITHWLIESIARSGETSLKIVDVCSGSGCIGLALARAFPESSVVALDNSAEAVALAQENKAKNSIENIEIRESDLFSAVLPSENFDLIVSNPPYLSQESFSFISPEVKRWEDYNALVGGSDGMDLYKRIINESPQVLSDRKLALPKLVMEIGIDQKNIEHVLLQQGFRDVRVMYDMSGKRRWVIGTI